MKFSWLQKLFIALIISALIYNPVIYAAQLSLPSRDLTAPEVSHEVIEGNLDAGSTMQIKATVTDNVGLLSVILFYRTKGSDEYKRLKMHRSGETDVYTITLGGRHVNAPGLEYYIEANDASGNTLLHGYSFSPLSVSVVEPGNNWISANQDLPRDSNGGKNSKKWLWIGLGILAVGAIATAASGGGNGGDDPPSEDGAVVVSGPTP